MKHFRQKTLKNYLCCETLATALGTAAVGAAAASGVGTGCVDIFETYLTTRKKIFLKNI